MIHYGILKLEPSSKPTSLFIIDGMVAPVLVVPPDRYDLHHIRVKLFNQKHTIPYTCGKFVKLVFTSPDTTQIITNNNVINDFVSYRVSKCAALNIVAFNRNEIKLNIKTKIKVQC